MIRAHASWIRALVARVGGLGVVLCSATAAAQPSEPAAPAPPTTPEQEEVLVAGTVASKTPGAAQILRKDQLDRFEYDDPGALLQQVPGVYVRGEDGIGLRPNLGIRGANPDRSKKLTLMEDGVLFGPAPYSAPAAYWFPLVTRMTQVRVIKGPAAIAYGPQTVGGAIDFLSRPIPEGTHGAADLAAGEYGYGKMHAWFGSSSDRVGFLVEGVRLQNTGFAELPNGADTGSTRNEWIAKAAYTFDPSAPTKHRLQLKVQYSDEVSNETYLGQTDADLRAEPYRRYAASALDQMKNHRTGVMVSHTMEGPASSYQLRTTAYRFDYQRAWKKLNRFGGQSVATVLANAEDPALNGYYAVLTGRTDSGSATDTLYVGPNDRTFVSQGIQTVLSTNARTGPLEHRFEAGLRFHYDSIRRLHTETGYSMQGGQLVSANQPVLTTADNFASTHAVAVHLTDALTWDRLTVTPGARVELLATRTEDYRANANANANADARVSAFMPGVGAYYALRDDLGALAGVYRGFSPPAPGTAGAKPEYSVNYEAGARFSRGRSRAELVGFFNDYSNLTDVCSLSGGCVTTNLDRQFDAGRARIYGLEAFAVHTSRVGAFAIPLSAAYTLSNGEFLTTFTSADPIYGTVRRGDELPYIPRHQLNVTAAAEHRVAGVNASFTYVAAMRERAGSAPLSAQAESMATDEQVWLDLGGYVKPLRWLRLYANLRNATGVAYIVGRRPYGARVNAPRWLQVGAKVEF